MKIQFLTNSGVPKFQIENICDHWPVEIVKIKDTIYKLAGLNHRGFYVYREIPWFDCSNAVITECNHIRRENSVCKDCGYGL